MTTPTTGCLFSTVVNAGRTGKRFSFLPPHGRYLAAGESFQMFGHPAQAISRGCPVADSRAQRSLATAIANGVLEVKSTPCPIVYDENDATSYALGSDSGSPIAAAADWGSST